MRHALGVGLREADASPRVAKRNPSTRARTIGCVHTASRRAAPRAPALRRAHRRRRLDGERHPRLPLAGRDLGAVRPDGVRDDRRLPARPGEGLEFYALRFEHADRGASRTTRTARWPSSSARGLVSAVVTQNIDLLHERAGSRVTWSRCTARSGLRAASRAATRVSARRGAARCSPAPRCPALRRRPEAGRRHVRRAAAAERDRPRVRARARRGAAARRRLLARGAPGRRPAARDGSRAGGAFAIVNRGSTSFDRQALLRIDASAGETLREVATVLG